MKTPPEFNRTASLRGYAPLWVVCAAIAATMLGSGCAENEALPSDAVTPDVEPPGERKADADVTDADELSSAPPESPLLADDFGICVPHLTYPRLADAEMRAAAGSRWVRRDVSWHTVEPEKGTFDFRAADAVIDHEMTAGIQVLVILDYGHPEYAVDANGSPHYPPDDLADFGRYVTEVVSHFRGRVAAYEIWNEPNFPIFWHPLPDPVQYAALVEEAAARVREADPSAIVVLGGQLGNWDPLLLNGRPWGFIEDAVAAAPELLEWVDVGAIHPYTWIQNVEPEVASGVTEAVQIGFVEMVDDFRRIATEAGRPDLPIWSTEQGWHTAMESVLSAGVTEEMQAALMVRAHVLAFSAGVQKVFQFTYSDGEADMTDKESHFGMVHHGADLDPDVWPEPKPAYDAYQTMTEMLGPLRYDRDLRREWGLSGDVFAFAFADDSTSVIVAWAVGETEVDVSLPAVPLSVRTMLGDVLEPRSETVRIGPSPFYLVMP